MIEKLFRRHPFALAFVVLGFIIVAFCVVVQNELDSRRALVETVAREQVSRRVEECESSNRSRAALQAVLDQVADPPPTGAASVDFSEVQGWGSLEPNVKFFLANLTVALQSEHPSFLVQVAEEYSKSNPQRDCLALERKLRADLRVNYPG